MDRQIVINEFLGIRNLLNRGNKLANEKTEFRFKAVIISDEEYRLYAFTRGCSDENRIEICRWAPLEGWERSGFTEFKNFENYCAEFINEWTKGNTLAEESESITISLNLETICCGLLDELNNL